MPARLPTPDWDTVGWHYRALHAFGTPWHNRLWIRARGVEHLPGEDGFVFAANHTSWWDPIAMSACLGRPVHWLAKKEIMGNAFTRWFFGRGGCIPVDRDARNPHALDAAVAALRGGQVIGVCPEGGRQAVGTLGRPKTGVARMALAADVPVVPAGVLTDRFWPKGRALPDLAEPIYVCIGPPLRLAGDPDDPEDARRESARVMAAVAALLEEARAARGRGEAWPAP